MSDTLITVLFVVLGFILIVLIILIVLLLKKNKGNGTPDDLMAVGEMKAKLDQVNKDISSTINNSMQDATIKALNQVSTANENSNVKLERFQQSINEGIDNKFKNLNEQLNTQIGLLNKRVDERLEGGFKTTTETVRSVTERLAKIDEAQKNIEALSGDVISLKSVLENNQQRGQFGEFQLSMILKNVFGETHGLYEEQYSIKGDNVRADAVVFLPPPYNMLCIDSKFPYKDYLDVIDGKDDDPSLEEAKKNFNKAFMKHVNDIKSKYIIPNKTAPQAFMFIPSDGVFAYLHVHLHDLIEEAQSKGVIVTSPATLQAMLATMAMLKINYERAQNLDFITNQIQGLSKDFNKWSDDWDKISKNISAVSNAQISLDNRARLMKDKFQKIHDSQIEQLEDKKEVD